MTTGLDLTDEFVAQFQALHARCESLQRQLDERANAHPPAPPPAPVAPDPKLTQQVQELTREVTRLTHELADRQEALDHALANEARALEQARQTPQTVVDPSAAKYKQDLERITTKAQRQIAELNAKIEQLEQDLIEQQSAHENNSAGGTTDLTFEEAFPNEARELNKLHETVFLYRKKYGPII